MSGLPIAEDRKVLASSFREKAEELLRVIQPLKAVVSKLNHTLQALDSTKPLVKPDALTPTTDIDLLQRCLRALVYKLDPVAESVAGLIDDFPRDETPTTVDPTPRPQHTASSTESFKTALSLKPKAAPPLNAEPKAKVTRVFKAEPKKAPPALRKKAPPPSTATGGVKAATVKKPPPKKGPPVTTAAPTPAPEAAKLDEELIPEVLPDANLVPKPIQWLGIPKSKVAGTIWDGLLSHDKGLCTARQVYVRMERESGAAKLSESSSSVASCESKESVCKTDEFKFEVEYKVLNELFFEKEEERAAKNPERRTSLADAAAAAAKSRCQTILDPRKSQILEIGLKGLGLVDDDFDQIRHAMDTLALDDTEDGDAGDTKRRDTAEGDTITKRKPWLLTVDRLERLLTLSPSADDVKQLEVLLVNCAPDQKIARADRFLIAISKIPRFEQRATSILTALTFDKEASNMAEKLGKFLSVMDAGITSVTSGVMKAVLALIIRIGNYINCKSKRPVVSGVQVSSLESLKQIKSVDGKRNLMRVIAEHVEEQFPIGWRHLEWLQSCAEVSEINLDDFRATLATAESKVKAIGAEVNHPEADANFKAFFGPFVEDSLTRIRLLQAHLGEASTKATKFAQLLADKAKTTSDCLTVLAKLAVFGRELFAAAKEIQQEKAATEKRKQRESLKAATPTRLRTAIPSRPSSHLSKRVLPGIPSQPLVTESPRPPSPSPTPVRPSSPQKIDFECSLLPQPPDNSSDVISSTTEEVTLNRGLRSRRSMPASVETLASPNVPSYDYRDREKKSVVATPSQAEYREPSCCRSGQVGRVAESRLRRRADESIASSSRFSYARPSPGQDSLIRMSTHARLHEAKGTSASRSSTHKKTRSHAYHQTVRSVADALSPSNSQTRLPPYPSTNYGPKDVREIQAQVMQRYSVLPVARSATREGPVGRTYLYHDESSDDSAHSTGAFRSRQQPLENRYSRRRNDELPEQPYSVEERLRPVHSPMYHRLASTRLQASEPQRVYQRGSGQEMYRQSPLLMSERQRGYQSQGRPHEMYNNEGAILSEGGVFLPTSPPALSHGRRWMNS